jgi:3-deoxy-D-manno-octulosonate 8-phosphate phosphatase (KDO 8-P phosphatase)
MIRLFVTDVDGVLTDGRMDYGVTGEDRKTFDVKDGQGIVMLMQRGVTVAFVSGRRSHALELRAAELGVERVHQRIVDKADTVSAIQKELGIGPAETAAMGDDLPDLAMFTLASLTFAPADAEAEVQEAATIVTRRDGGRGAFRDAARHVLQHNADLDD